MHEVHRPHIVWTNRHLTIFPKLRPDPALRSLVPQLQAQVPVDAIGSLDVGAPTLAFEQHVHTAVAVAMGHSVRIIPAQFVKPYVKSNKNDIIDAAAIAEAATRPTMRFVGIKQADQVDLQMLHRVRSRLVSARTNLICQMRAYCLEHGIAMRQGAGVFKLDICRVLDDPENDLTVTARGILRDLHEDLQRLEARIRQVSNEIENIADADERARRLMSIPGIGPLGATAILSAIGDPTRFAKARDIAAWLGLVPRQYSTGGKQNLLGISKRGNNYLRRLIIHGARSCLMHLDRSKDRLGIWIDELRSRMHVNKVTVALAAKLARIVWVVLTRPGATYMRQPAA